MNVHKQKIDRMFTVFAPNQDAHTLPFATGPEFYQKLDQKFNDFAGHLLMSCHACKEPWDSWEAHPNGDEVVMLLSGTVTITLRAGGIDHGVDLDAPGDYLVVPRGIWHTASRAENAQLLFFTPGEGTKHATQPPREE